MNTKRWIWHAAAVIAAVLLSIWWLGKRLGQGESGGAYPAKPIRLVVPYPAGGGSDTFARIIQKGIASENLLGQPLVVFNHAGGSGTIGSRKVKNARPDGYAILCSHNAVITAKLAGTVDYGMEVFEPICLTGTMAMVIIVREDSPFAGLPELLEAARQRPRELTFGANRGAPAYFTALQLQQTVPGAEFSMVTADGGADRYARILGGHLDAGIFSLSEFLDFRRPEGTPPAENVRALVLLSPERHEAIPGVATSAEQGVPVYSRNANYWLAPKSTPPEVIDYLAAALEKAMGLPEIRQRLADLRIDPEYLAGREFRQYLAETEEQFEEAAGGEKMRLPDFPKLAGFIVLALFFWMLWSERKKDVSEAGESLREPGRLRVRAALLCALVLILYVLVLQWGALPYALAAALFAFVAGGLVSDWDRAHRIVLIELALLTGLATEYVFTEIFTVALP